MKEGNKVDSILLDEIRLNRRAITKLDDKFTTQLAQLDREVFSNKIKLSFFIAGVSLISSIIVILIAEKIKTLT